jgi:outer membrane lipoprotein-sorting protein
MNAKVSGILLLLLGLTCGLPGRAALTPADRDMVGKAESYLNGVTTLSARFLQVAPNGDTSEGTFTLSRPGHLRLDYDAPSQVVIYADSNWLTYRDNKLNQTSYLDIDSSPAGLLIKPQLKLDGDGQAVTKVTHRPGVLEITVVKAADPHQGDITLVFSEAPFQLRQWLVTDAQGQVTHVSLFDAHLDAKFASDWFRFKNPNGFDPLK